MGEANAAEKQSFVEVFMAGARRGVNMWLNSVVPGVVLSVLILRIIEVTGIMNLLGTILGPVMGLFGLPGEAAIAYLGCLISMVTGCVSAVAMVAEGILTVEHVTILLPMLMLTGNTAAIGRILAVTGVKGKSFKACYIIMILCSLLAGLLMRIIVSIF